MDKPHSHTHHEHSKRKEAHRHLEETIEDHLFRSTSYLLVLHGHYFSLWKKKH